MFTLQDLFTGTLDRRISVADTCTNMLFTFSTLHYLVRSLILMKIGSQNL